MKKELTGIAIQCSTSEILRYVMVHCCPSIQPAGCLKESFLAAQKTAVESQPLWVLYSRVRRRLGV